MIKKAIDYLKEHSSGKRRSERVFKLVYADKKINLEVTKEITTPTDENRPDKLGPQSILRPTEKEYDKMYDKYNIHKKDTIDEKINEIKVKKEKDDDKKDKKASIDKQAKSELLASYDESDIYQDSIESKKEELKDEGFEGTEEELNEQAKDRAEKDTDYYSFAFDNFVEEVKNIFHGLYEIGARNMGWQNKSGHKTAEIDSFEDLQNKVLPKTSELTIKIYKGDKDGEISMIVYHHDSPTGESYYFVPAKILPEGTKVKSISKYNDYDIGKIIDHDIVNDTVLYMVEDKDGRNSGYDQELGETFEVIGKRASEKTPIVKHAIWQDKLRNVYANEQEWEQYANKYNLHTKLGFATPHLAFESNPVIMGSDDPEDYGLAEKETIRAREGGHYGPKPSTKK